MYRTTPTMRVLGAATFLCLSALTLPAQNVPPTADGTPPEIQYPNTPLRFILQDYETVSGKLIIKDQTILDGFVTIETVHPVRTNAEWLDFIERSLLLNGIALVPVSDNMLKVVNWQSQTPNDKGIKTYDSEYDLPEGEVVVNYIMELEFITTDEATRIFQEVTKNTGTNYAGISQVPDANMLIITENALIVKQLIALKKQIDVKPAQVTTRVFQLERADVETVSAAINDILSQQQQQSNTGTTRTNTTRRTTPTTTRTPGAPPGLPGASAAASPSPTGGPGATQPIVVYPDIRTNRLIVIARPLDVTYIENLVKELDAEVEVKRFINRSLSHVSVESVLPVLENALSLHADPASTSGTGGALSSNLGGQNRATGFGQNQGRFGGNNFNTGNRNFGGNNFGGSGFGGTGGGRGGSTSGSIFGDVDTGPLSIPVGKSLLIADPKSNNIIASGPPEDLQLVNTILDEIDVKPRQVYLSTIIGQVTLGNDINWGLDLLHRVQEYDVGGRNVRSGGLFQTGDGSNVIDLDSLDVVSNFPKVAGLNYYAQIGDYVNAYLRALESTNRFEVLSRPSIYIRNNRIGVISSGQAVAVPSSTQSSFTGGTGTTGLISNIEYRDVVLELQVQPLINSDDEITLKVRQVNDDIIGSQNIQGTEVPTIGTQELETEVTVPNKSTIVLGGLITESRSDARDGLPVLVHVPLLKHIFGENTKQRNRQELLIFLQPHIINSTSDLVDANVEQTELNRVTRSALEFGKKRENVPEETGRSSKRSFRNWFRPRNR